MPLSRLRVRLTAWFALAFFAGLAALNLTLNAYLRHAGDLRLTRHLRAEAAELAQAVRIEYEEAPERGLEDAVQEALKEWPERPVAFAVYAPSGVRLGVRGRPALEQALPASAPVPMDPAVRDSLIFGSDEHPMRVILLPYRKPALVVAAAGSTKPVAEENETLALWFGLSTPLAVVLSLAAGYVLSRHALGPVKQLGRAVAGLSPNELHQRLPTHPVPDELDLLAAQFNGLLERLERAQAQNRRFLRQAAHQIRTPLTLVLGEAELSLDRERSAVEQRQALGRIRTAAHQMKRRVDELFLLAQAEAGERVDISAAVELDGLVLECADLMRARAQALGHRLELLRVEPVAAQGNEMLLKEGVLELIENACRHGRTDRSIAISAFELGTSVCVQVRSVGSELANRGTAADDHGMGLAILSWIAAEHEGRLTYERNGDVNVFGLLLPSLVNQAPPPGATKKAPTT